MIIILDRSNVREIYFNSWFQFIMARDAWQSSSEEAVHIAEE